MYNREATKHRANSSWVYFNYALEAVPTSDRTLRLLREVLDGAGAVGSLAEILSRLPSTALHIAQDIESIVNLVYRTALAE